MLLVKVCNRKTLFMRITPVFPSYSFVKVFSKSLEGSYKCNTR